VRSPSTHGLARRRFVIGAGSLLAVPAPAYGQRVGKVHRIGVLGTTSPKSHGAFVEAFSEGLRERGYIEGKTVVVEVRWAATETLARTAKSIGIEIVQTTARSTEEFDGAFGQITRAQCEAVIVYEDPLFLAEAKRLAALSDRHRLPSAGFRELADAGGLLGFGVNFPAVWRHAASFVDRIFKGARPGHLPMEQPAKFDTVVNLRTARTLRLTIQPKVLLRAETVIE
jgi:ABC transporter substrate binding protein